MYIHLYAYICMYKSGWWGGGGGGGGGKKKMEILLKDPQAPAT